MNITKVVIPAAGYGTRFLPITKSIPKEMLPLLNKPALQYAVQEAADAGINHCCVIINKEKQAIENYFSRDRNLEALLEKSDKLSLIQDLNRLIEKTAFSYIIQPKMLGLGNAIAMARNNVDHSFFAVMLPDDMIFHNQPGIGQLIAVAQKTNATVIAVVEVPPSEISAYGSIKVKRELSGDLVEVEDIIEKPKPHEAFSNLAIIGRYVLSPKIFDAIEAITPTSKGEIQLTDALVHLARNGHPVLAYKIKGNRFDLGRPQGWLAANIFLEKELASNMRKK